MVVRMKTLKSGVLAAATLVAFLGVVPSAAAQQSVPAASARAKAVPVARAVRSSQSRPRRQRAASVAAGVRVAPLTETTQRSSPYFCAPAPI